MGNEILFSVWKVETTAYYMPLELGLPNFELLVNLAYEILQNVNLVFNIYDISFFDNNIYDISK